MKNLLLTCSFAMLLLVSCKKDTPAAPAPAPTPPPVESPAPPPAPKPQVQAATPPTTAPAAPAEKDGTSVSLDGNGVNVSTKNGGNDSKVVISKTKKEVKFSTN
jgi:hypothetical protein